MTTWTITTIKCLLDSSAAIDGNREQSTAIEYIATTPSLVIDRSAKPAASSKTSMTITNIAEDVTYYAVFKSDPEVFVTVDATDGVGAEPTGKGAGKYVAGTITGMGKYAPGKKVTLKAAANKGYVFAGWAARSASGPYQEEVVGSPRRGDRNDGLLGVTLPDDLVSQAASLSFEMPSNDVEYVAMFVTAEEDKDSIELSVNGEEMRLAGDGSPHQTNIWAGVYLEWPVAASALSETKVKVAGLPSGLKFTDKPVTSKIGSGKTAVTVTNVPANTIYGAPTAASKVTTDRKTGAVTVTPSAVKFTVTTAGKSSQTYQIDMTVDALPDWAVGTFDGGVVGSPRRGDRDDGQLGERALPGEASGQVLLTIAAGGKISGKLLEDGKTWTLSAAWFDAVECPSSDVDESVFHATVIGKSGKEEITNEVEVAAEEIDAARSASGPYRRGVVAARLASGPYQEMEWNAWQNLWKVDPWKTLGKTFDKKTLAYAILPDGSFSEAEDVLTAALSADVTARVTLKFAASGTASVAGEFVTGFDEKKQKYTTVKASGSATLVPVDEEKGSVFIYLTPKGLPPHARALSVPWP